MLYNLTFLRTCYAATKVCSPPSLQGPFPGSRPRQPMWWRVECRPTLSCRGSTGESYTASSTATRQRECRWALTSSPWKRRWVPSMFLLWTRVQATAVRALYVWNSKALLAGVEKLQQCGWASWLPTHLQVFIKWEIKYKEILEAHQNAAIKFNSLCQLYLVCWGKASYIFFCQRWKQDFLWKSLHQTKVLHSRDI